MYDLFRNRLLKNIITICIFENNVYSCSIDNDDLQCRL